MGVSVPKNSLITILLNRPQLQSIDALINFINIQ